MIMIVVTCQRHAGGAKVVREFNSLDRAETYCAVQRFKGWRCGITGKARKAKEPAVSCTDMHNNVRRRARGYYI